MASKMAAIETIRRGFQRYLITGTTNDNNSDYVFIPSGENNVFGGQLWDFGTSDVSLRVVMLNPGDRGFNRALDARQQLGPEWQTLAENGVQTCEL